MLHAGQVVDRYIVEVPLGEGGMAMVYRVRHQTLGSLHALKVLTVEGDRVKERLLAEGRAQGRLQHPNALTVTDIVDVDGSPGLVMEYIEHGTLEDWVEHQHPDRDDRLEVFRQICSAVAAAHDLGWIHRDLKPSNVLMDRVGEHWIPKVADFGLVKAEVPLGKAKTRQGIAMGTPGFMAREQFTDAANVTAAADVFSLGCILIWLLTDAVPFGGETPMAVYKNVASNSHIGLKPSDPLAPLSERCLAPDPRNRPQSARALLKALSPIVPSAEPVDFSSLTQNPAPVRQERAPAAEVASPSASPASSPPSSPPSLVRRGVPLLGCSTLVAGAVALGIVAVLLVLLMPTARRAHLMNQQFCNLDGAGSMGYVQVDQPVRPGAMLTLNQGVDVHGVYDGKTERRCHLPVGTTVRVGTIVRDQIYLDYDPSASLPTEAAMARLLFGAPAN